MPLVIISVRDRCYFFQLFAFQGWNRCFLTFLGVAQRAQCVPGRVVDGVARGMTQNQVGIDPGFLM